MGSENKFIVFIFLIFNCVIFSQTTIKGRIAFDNNEKNTSVSILLKQGDKTIDYTFSNPDNTYFLETDKTGLFTLIFSSFNFSFETINIEITSKTKEIERSILLRYKPIELNEVLLINEKSIKILNDTIVFKANSFLQGDEQVVEDLLKKIPGLNIDANGTIKVGNQEIEKVMIDGDDLFEKGYKILTKNMPVNPIDKVELYQNYSNNKHLKGIENSNKVALNLTLKEDAKRIWFGNNQTGYGIVSENRYEIRSILMNFGKKNKFYFLSNLNNTGYEATGDINHLIRPYRIDEPGSIGDDQIANTVLGLGFDTPNLKQKRTHLNNAEMLSLNSIFNLSNKVKLKTLSFLKTDEVDFLRNSRQQFSVGNTTFTNTEDFIGRKTEFIGFGKIDITYDINKTKTYYSVRGSDRSKRKKNR